MTGSHPCGGPEPHLRGMQVGVFSLVTVASRGLAVRRDRVSPTATGPCLASYFFSAASEALAIQEMLGAGDLVEREDALCSLQGSEEFVSVPRDQGALNVPRAKSRRAPSRVWCEGEQGLQDLGSRRECCDGELGPLGMGVRRLVLQDRTRLGQ